MDAFEDRLRSALHGKAREVRPDPETWNRVQARIARRRMMAWATPATAVAAVVAVAVLVVPGLLPGEDRGIELIPADSGDGEPEGADPETESDPDAEQDTTVPVDDGPAIEALPAFEGRVAGVVWVGGGSHRAQTVAGDDLGGGPIGDAAGMTVSPGSDIGGFAYATAPFGPDGACRAGAVYGDGGYFSGDAPGDCSTAPRFSPDGAQLARSILDGDPVLDIRGFGRQGPDDQPTASIPIEGAEGDVEVVAWLPPPAGSTVEELWVLDRGADGSLLYPVPAFPRPDGELTVPDEIVLEEYPPVETGGWDVEAVAARHGTVPRSGDLVSLQTREGSARLWVGPFDEPLAVVDLPDDLAGAGHLSWLSSEGDDVLVGDGTGGVWYVELDHDEPRVTELDVDWTGAAFLPFERDHEEGPVEDGPIVTAYFVRSGPDRLWVEPARVVLGAPTVGVARAAVEAAVAEAPEGLETLAPTGTRVLGATIRDGVLRVDLSADVIEGQVGGEGEQMFAQQLAHTAAQFDNVEAVRLLVAGEEVDELWGHLDWGQPIEPDEGALTPVVISEVTVDDGRVTVSGESTTYEGTVELALLDPEGQRAEETFTTSTCGGPCRGEWSHTFDTPARSEGAWVVEAAQPEVTSEGSPPFTARAEVVVE
jgi:hypothetical protein